MNKALYPAIAIAFAACMEPAVAQDVSLICTLRSGNRLPLTIAGKRVLKDGRALKNFDRNSFVAGPTRITFNQSFGTYRNAWTIDRDYRQIGFKTILKDGSHVVLEDKGSCTSALAPQHGSYRGLEAGFGFSSRLLGSRRRACA